MTADREQRKREGDRLYERYGRPLEAEHGGKYLAIAQDGRTLLGGTALEVAQEARRVLGPGSFLFKIGERAVWTLR